MYCGDNPVMRVDPSGMAWWEFWKWDWAKIGMIALTIVGTTLFVAAIIASAGTVGALAGVGAAALGLSVTTVSTIATIATIGTYVIAAGVGLFGLSDTIEIATDGLNPIRDWVMGGSQTAYNITKGIFNALGTVAILAGSFGPKILQKVAGKYGDPVYNKAGKLMEHKYDFYDKTGKWSARIDATVHSPNGLHHNPHLHMLARDTKQGGIRKDVYYFWEIIKKFLGLGG